MDERIKMLDEALKVFESMFYKNIEHQTIIKSHILTIMASLFHDELGNPDYDSNIECKLRSHIWSNVYNLDKGKTLVSFSKLKAYTDPLVLSDYINPILSKQIHLYQSNIDLVISIMNKFNLW